MNSWRSAWLLTAVLALVAAAPMTNVRAGGHTVQIRWLSQVLKRTLPLSYLDQAPHDEGIQGARLGIVDDDTTGRFTGQSFALVEAIIPENGDIGAGFRELTAKGGDGDHDFATPRRNFRRISSGRNPGPSSRARDEPIPAISRSRPRSRASPRASATCGRGR